MNETQKWISHRISAIILAPVYIWLYFSLISLSTKNYSEATYFFNNPLFGILTIAVFFTSISDTRVFFTMPAAHFVSVISALLLFLYFKENNSGYSEDSDEAKIKLFGYEILLRLIEPMTPHIAEEIWQ